MAGPQVTFVFRDEGGGQAAGGGSTAQRATTGAAGRGSLLGLGATLTASAAINSIMRETVSRGFRAFTRDRPMPVTIVSGQASVAQETGAMVGARVAGTREEVLRSIREPVERGLARARAEIDRRTIGFGGPAAARMEGVARRGLAAAEEGGRRALTVAVERLTSIMSRLADALPQNVGRAVREASESVVAEVRAPREAAEETTRRARGEGESERRRQRRELTQDEDRLLRRVRRLRRRNVRLGLPEEAGVSELEERLGIRRGEEPPSRRLRARRGRMFGGEGDAGGDEPPRRPRRFGGSEFRGINPEPIERAVVRGIRTAFSGLTRFFRGGGKGEGPSLMDRVNVATRFQRRGVTGRVAGALSDVGGLVPGLQAGTVPAAAVGAAAALLGIPIAVRGVIGAFRTLVAVVRKVNQDLDRVSERSLRFSPELQSVRAQREIRDLLSDMRRAERFGSRLAQRELMLEQIGRNVDRFRDEFREAALNTLLPMLQALNGLVAVIGPLAPILGAAPGAGAEAGLRLIFGPFAPLVIKILQMSDSLLNRELSKGELDPAADLFGLFGFVREPDDATLQEIGRKYGFAGTPEERGDAVIGDRPVGFGELP